MPCGLTAVAVGVRPLATVFGISGRSAPEPLTDEPNWETPPVRLSAAYTNGARAVAVGGAAPEHPPATEHPPASTQAVTASLAADPIRRPHLTQPRFLATLASTAAGRPPDSQFKPDSVR